MSLDWISCYWLCFSFCRSVWRSSVDILSLKPTHLHCVSGERRSCARRSSNWTLTISAFPCVTGSTPCGIFHTHRYWSDWRLWTRQSNEFVGLVCYRWHQLPVLFLGLQCLTLWRWILVCCDLTLGNLEGYKSAYVTLLGYFALM